jgi:hypothetical protein
MRPARIVGEIFPPSSADAGTWFFPVAKKSDIVYFHVAPDINIET